MHSLRPELWFGALIAVLASLLNITACSALDNFLVATADSSVEVVAVLEGVSITDKDLNIQGELMRLEQEAYQIRRDALEREIARRLLAAEASKNGMEIMELLAVMADSRVSGPTSREVRAYYEKRRAHLRKPFDELEGKISETIKENNLQRARNAYVSELRQAADLEVKIIPPRLPVDLENAHARGPEGAPITLVEFSDFQCPFCKRVQPTLKEVFEEYDGKIRWHFKDLPLKKIHPGAVRAAEAARCAGEQGQFWNYRDALFELGRVTDDVHPKVARGLDLDHALWNACIDSGKYFEAVEADSSEAKNLGIRGTPAFLINGILLSGAQPKEAFVRLIEAELLREVR